jgi:hypothetical protein
MSQADMKNSGQPWKTDNWYVSSWNYLEEVTKGFKPPKSIKIHDITLRDGEQQAGIILKKDDKIQIAEKLSEVGIHRIEAGMPPPMTRPPFEKSSSATWTPRSFVFRAV